MPTNFKYSSLLSRGPGGIYAFTSNTSLDGGISFTNNYAAWLGGTFVRRLNIYYFCRFMFGQKRLDARVGSCVWHGFDFAGNR